jgi:hypothetical protein
MSSLDRSSKRGADEKSPHRLPNPSAGNNAAMADGRGNVGGIGIGGILVVVGILLAIFWSVWVGIILALVGLIAFGGFAKGRWY